MKRIAPHETQSIMYFSMTTRLSEAQSPFSLWEKIRIGGEIKGTPTPSLQLQPSPSRRGSKKTLETINQSNRSLSIGLFNAHWHFRRLLDGIGCLHRQVTIDLGFEPGYRFGYGGIFADFTV